MNATVYDLAAYRSRRQSLAAAWVRFWFACCGLRSAR